MLGGSVTLTDVAGVVPALQQNSNLHPGPPPNLTVVSMMTTYPLSALSVDAAAVDWLHPETALALGRADIVLGADIVWMLDLIQPMVHAMRALCKQVQRIRYGMLQHGVGQHNMI